MTDSGTDFAVIIAAGGSGSRFSKNLENTKPKQFLTLRGLPLFAWSLKAFAQHHLVTQFVISTPANLITYVESEVETLKKQLGIRQQIDVVSGGSTRQASVFNGLDFLAKKETIPEFVFVHDAARPFLDIQTVDLVARKAIEYGACTVGGAVSDTIKRVDGTRILETLKREELVAVQTPQVARFQLLYGAHKEAILTGYSTTDDVALLEWAGHEVHIVEGPTHNLKLTNPLDLIMAEALADYLYCDHFL